MSWAVPGAGIGQFVNEILEGDQFPTELAQLGDPVVDLDDLAAQDISDIATGPLATVAQREDLANFVEGDAQTLSRLDEGEQFGGLIVVVPVAGFGSFGLRKETDALVIADGPGVQP